MTTGRGSLGYRMNTNHAGQHFFSELDLHGGEHKQTRLASITYDPPCGAVFCPPSIEVETASIQVWGGVLFGMLVDGTWIMDSDFAQTRWLIEAYGPHAGVFELTVEATPDQATGEPLYTFFWDDGLGEGPQAMCLEAGQSQQMEAKLYADLEVDEYSGVMSEQPGLLYIGCRAGAVGKAGSWGYDRDNLQAMHGSDGLPLFEASVRMLRADYCGDGQSWTEAGTPVDVQDTLNINPPLPTIGLPTTGPGPVDEAVWSRYGAVCLNAPRIAGKVVSCRDSSIVWPCFWGTASAFADPAAVFLTTTPP